MNAAYGTNRLIYEDTRWALGKQVILFITIPLASLWFLLGLFVNLEYHDVITIIWGPIYYFICHFAAAEFRKALPIAVGLGSTRKKCLTSFIMIGLTGVAVTLFIINGLEYFLVLLGEKGIISIDVKHIASFIYADYQFFSFYLIDLAIGFFLFGTFLLLSSIHYLVGFMKMSITLVIFSVLFIVPYYLGTLDPLFNWIMALETATIFTMIGGAGMIATVLSYLLMLNAPLEKKASRF
ncbi:hypothetical protein [Pradoshia sp.]